MWWIPLAVQAATTIAGGLGAKAAPKTGVGPRYTEAMENLTQREQDLLNLARTGDFGAYDPWQAMRGSLGAMRGQAGDWQRSLARRSTSGEQFQYGSQRIMENLARKVAPLEIEARRGSSASKAAAGQVRSGLLGQAANVAGQRMGFEADTDMYRRQEQTARYNQRMSMLSNLLGMGAGMAGGYYSRWQGKKDWTEMFKQLEGMDAKDREMVMQMLGTEAGAGAAFGQNDWFDAVAQRLGQGSYGLPGWGGTG
jgi:hypothetical protein